MNAILLCAGDGKRLMPITRFKPKPLIEINNKKDFKLIDYWIEKLIKEINVKKILINLNYKSNLIKHHLNKSKYRNRIILSFEKNKLGTAGTLIKNTSFFENKDGMLLHSDNICNENLKNFLNFHKRNIKKNNFSILAFKTYDKKNSGILIKKKNILTEFYEKKINAPGNLANGAIYIISKSYLKIIKKEKFNDFSNDIIPKNLNKACVFETKKFFMDIGNIKNLNFVRMNKKIREIG